MQDIVQLVHQTTQHYIGFENVTPQPAKIFFLFTFKEKYLAQLQVLKEKLGCFVVCTVAVKSLHTSGFAFTY